MENHRSNLSEICRNCFKLLDRKEFSAKKIHEIINKAFFIYTATDNENLHLTQLCQKCLLHATMAIKRYPNTYMNA